MVIDRRTLLQGGIALYGSALVPGAGLAARSAERTFGLIEISTSGITVSVYQLSKETLASAHGLSGYERLAPKRVGGEVPRFATPLVPGSEEKAIQDTVAIIASQVDLLTSKMEVRPADLAVVVSSGVESYAGSVLPRLAEAVEARTGATLDVIGARDEARMQFDWIVPPHDRGDVLQLDIGSGNTKGGYYDRKGPKGQYLDVSTPFGTKTLAAAVKGRWPEIGTANFPRRAAEFYADTVAPSLEGPIKAAPQVQQLPDLYITGGIVWASAVILYPGEILARRDWLAMLPGDFARIGKLVEAGAPYGIVPESLTGDERARLLKIRAAVRSIFNPHQIAAGAALLDGLSRQMNFAGRRKLLFPTFANNAWSSQFLIERFAADRG